MKYGYLLNEVMWDRIDDIEKLSTHKMKNVKSSNVLRKVKKGDYTYYLTDYMSDDVFYGEVFAFYKDDIFIGECLVAKWNGDPNSDYLEASVSVHPEHRRKGVATDMYNIAERYFNKKFRPASSNTKDAQMFWKSRKS